MTQRGDNRTKNEFNKSLVGIEGTLAIISIKLNIYIGPESFSPNLHLWEIELLKVFEQVNVSCRPLVGIIFIRVVILVHITVCSFVYDKIGATGPTMKLCTSAPKLKESLQERVNIVFNWVIDQLDVLGSMLHLDVQKRDPGIAALGGISG